jgi:hypothetical protein
MPRTTTLALALVAAALLAACGGADTASGTDSGSRKLLATTSVASTFGVTAANGLLTVDSGAGLVFVVKQAGGDITSIRCSLPMTTPSFRQDWARPFLMQCPAAWQRLR